jgi:hypothetical protein
MNFFYSLPARLEGIPGTDGNFSVEERLKTPPLAPATSIRFRDPAFAHPEPHILTHPALLNDFSAVVGNDAPDLVEFVRFDHELK